MDLILLGFVWIEIIITVSTIIGGIIVIFILNRLKKELILSKNRIRILRDFKEIYNSYCTYRTDILADKSEPLKYEKVRQLTCNKLLGDENFFENIHCQDNYLIYQSKLCRLDLLSEDFSIFYEGVEGELIQSFIFWYHTLILEIGSYRKRVTGLHGNSSRHELSIKGKITQLEKTYQKINEKFLIEQLESMR